MTNGNMSLGPKGRRTVSCLRIGLDEEKTDSPVTPHCPTNEGLDFIERM